MMDHALPVEPFAWRLDRDFRPAPAAHAEYCLPRAVERSNRPDKPGAISPPDASAIPGGGKGTSLINAAA